MIIGTCANGQKCVYDLPMEIKTAEEFESLICGYNNGRLAESQREELYNQPKLLGLNGPMYNGTGTLRKSGETVVIIRYEKPSKFEAETLRLGASGQDGNLSADDGNP